MTRKVLLWDVAGVASALVAGLRADLEIDHVVGRSPGELRAHLDRAGADIVHVVVPDDGTDLPIDTGASNPSPIGTDLLGHAPTPCVVVLDGCYQFELAENLRAAGCTVIGLPGRLGRGNANDFLRAWYARPASEQVEFAFDEAMSSTRLHRLPDLVQPQLHHAGRTAQAVFRGPDGPEPGEVTVWYGTNRRPDPASGRLYGTEPDDTLHTGRCLVHVPAGVPIGRTRARRERGRAGSREYSVGDHHALSRDALLTELTTALADREVGERSLLVYLHGYRTTFIEAATRAAQLHVDLGYPGRMAFFSWPSRGETSGYFADEDTVQHAERHLLTFLTDLSRHIGAEQINVIAHSMGNRALLRVAMRLAATAAADRPRLGHVLLAAADVGRHFFQTEASVYPTVSESVTCYVSSGDKALRSSGVIHRGDRAGLTPPVTVVDGIDTVDASEIDLTFLGHGYYAAARPVLADMHAVLHGQHKPDSRFGLERRTDSDGKATWLFRP